MRPFTAGNFGQSYYFDGVNDYINCGSGNSSLKLTNTLTLEAWIYFAGPVSGNVYFIASRYNWGPNRGYCLYVNNSYGKLIFQAGADSFDSGFYPPVGKFCHIAVTYDSGAASKNINFYANGILVNSQDYTTAITNDDDK